MDSSAVSTQETPEKTLKVEVVAEKTIAHNRPGGKKNPEQLKILALAREKALKIRVENARMRQLEKDIADAEKFEKRLALQKKHKEIFEKVIEPEPEPEPETPRAPKKKKVPEPESDSDDEYTYVRVKKKSLLPQIPHPVPVAHVPVSTIPHPQMKPPLRSNSLFSAY